MDNFLVQPMADFVAHNPLLFLKTFNLVLGFSWDLLLVTGHLVCTNRKSHGQISGALFL